MQLPVEYRRLLDELAARPTEDGGLTREEASALESLLPSTTDGAPSWPAVTGAR